MLSVMHKQSCCFAYKTYCFFDILIAVCVIGSLSRHLYPTNYCRIVGVIMFNLAADILKCLIETTERAWSWIRKGQNKWTWPQRTRSEEHQTQAWVRRWKHPILSCSTQAWVQKYVSKVEIPLLIYLLKSFPKRPGTVKSKLQY